MNAKNVHLIYILLLLTGLFAGACRGDEDMEPRLPGSSGDTLSRTLIIYMAAENSLHSYLQTDSLEIAWGLDSLDEDCRVVLFMDDRLSTRLCVGTRKEPLQTVKTYEGNLCSTDSQTMVNVLKDIFHLYPARNYGLVLCSHGSGWIFDDPVASSQSVSRRSFGIDNGRRSSSNQGRRMNIPTLAGVLSGFPHFDYLFFDVCFMQCVEVAYELRHAADYIIASAHVLSSDGLLMTEFVRGLKETGDAEKAGGLMFERSTPYWQNSYMEDASEGEFPNGDYKMIRTDKFQPVIDVSKRLCDRILALYPTKKEAIDRATSQVYRFHGIRSNSNGTLKYEWENPFFDIANYAQLLAKETGDAEFEAISEDMDNAFKDAFVHYRDVNNSVQHLEHYTLSVCLLRQLFYTLDYKTVIPELKPLNNYNEGYEKCDFHKLTGWGNWLNTNQQALDSNPQKGGGGKLE